MFRVMRFVVFSPTVLSCLSCCLLWFGCGVSRIVSVFSKINYYVIHSSYSRYDHMAVALPFSQTSRHNQPQVLASAVICVCFSNTG